MKYAGVFRRAFGYIFDDMILSISEIFVAVYYQQDIMNFVRNMEEMQNPSAMTILQFYQELFLAFKPLFLWSLTIGLVLYVLYAIWLPIRWNGQTIGRKVVGVRVVSLHQETLTFSQMFLREFVGKVLWWILTLGLGIFIDWAMIGLRKDKRALRDLMAGTAVELLEGEFVKSEYDQF